MDDNHTILHSELLESDRVTFQEVDWLGPFYVGDCNASTVSYGDLPPWTLHTWVNRMFRLHLYHNTDTPLLNCFFSSNVSDVRQGCGTFLWYLSVVTWRLYCRACLWNLSRKQHNRLLGIDCWLECKHRRNLVRITRCSGSWLPVWCSTCNGLLEILICNKVLTVRCSTCSSLLYILSGNEVLTICHTGRCKRLMWLNTDII